MDRRILQDYIDACELIKETEEDIRYLRKTEVVHDKVRGSNPEFPFQLQSFNVSGTIEIDIDSEHLQEEMDLLLQRQKNAKRIKVQVEKWMNTVPLRMQRIIRCKFFEGMSWEEVANRVGRGATENGLKKEFERFMKR